MLRRLDVSGRDIIRRKIAGNDPPANPFKSGETLDRPDRHIGSDMPGRPFANTAVGHAFTCEVSTHLGTSRVAPFLFRGGIVVIGKGHRHPLLICTRGAEVADTMPP